MNFSTPDISISSELYRTMKTIRLAELRLCDIYPSDKIQSPVHLSIGQEAVAAGVCQALLGSDRIYGTYRGHGLYIAKGGTLKKMFAELYAKDSGCGRGKGGSMHLVAPEVGLMGCSAIVASTIPVAVGDALASNMQGRSRVTVAFFGDGAVDEGVFFESLNFAILKNLPIVFVCENNALAIHSKVSDRHKQTEIFRFGEGLGVPGQRLNGNDVFEVYGTMGKAVDAVRNGGPPQLIEYMTYRWQEHVGTNQDHQEIYRIQEEIDSALRNDPLVLAKVFLEDHFQIEETQFKEWESAIELEINEAVKFAEESPFPQPEELYEGLYA